MSLRLFCGLTNCHQDTKNLCFSALYLVCPSTWHVNAQMAPALGANYMKTEVGLNLAAYVKSFSIYTC
jgi:hypothetical protein